MKLVENITKILAKLGMSLSILVGIVGAVWLLFLGQWQFALIYIVAGGIVSWIYSRYISVIIDKPFLAIIERDTYKNKSKNKSKTPDKKSPKVIATIEDFIVNDLIMCIWITLITYKFFQFIKISGHSVPVLLLGYFICILPVANLLSKDTHSETFTNSILTFCQIAYWGLIASFFTDYFIIFVPLILISLIVLTFLIRESTAQGR